MEVLSEGKNFRLLHEDELTEVLRILSEYLPESIKFHETLKTYMNDRVWDFHFYVCKTWPEQLVILHFPGMTKTPHGVLYESFSVFCPQSRLNVDFDLLLAEDQLLDWQRPIYLNFTHVAIIQRLEEHYTHALGGQMDKLCGDVYSNYRAKDCNGGSNGFVVNGHFAGTTNGLKNGDGKDITDITASTLTATDMTPTDSAEDAQIDSEASMLQLSIEHAPTIYDLYPAREMECLDIFSRLIDRLPCYGMFTNDGELVAWMVQSYYGAMFSMQTRPEYRRRGYGQKLARALTHEVARRGYLPFVVIRPENEASLCLYHKLGFRKNFETVRAILRPSGYPPTGDGVAGGSGCPGGTEEDAEADEVAESTV